MPKAKNPALKPRKCKYCHAIFTPKRSQDHAAKFCTSNHRKEYWRHGSLPFDKLMGRVEKETRRIVREEFASLIAAQSSEVR